MLTISLVVLTFAVLCWPVRPAATRARVLCGWKGRVRRTGFRPGPRTVAVIVAVACCMVSGPAAAFSALLLAWTIGRGRRAASVQGRQLAADTSMAEALSALVAELRGGAHPGVAAERVARESRGVASAPLRTIANTVRLGGSVRRALARVADEFPPLALAVVRIGRAWELADRHGLPLAEVIDAVRSDLENRARFARGVHARMAGPRSSALVLAALPVLGVLLGVAMGANPLAVLFGGGIGGILLVLGSGLTTAGVLWTARLTGEAVST